MNCYLWNKEEISSQIIFIDYSVIIEYIVEHAESSALRYMRQEELCKAIVAFQIPCWRALHLKKKKPQCFKVYTPHSTRNDENPKKERSDRETATEGYPLMCDEVHML